MASVLTIFLRFIYYSELHLNIITITIRINNYGKFS